MTSRLSPVRSFVVSLSLVALATAAQAGAPQVSAQEDAARPFIVKIHADWCGTCTRLEPTWEALRSRYGDEVRFVVLDVTDREAVARSAALAESLGLTAFFDANKSKTGTVGVLDARGETVKVLKGELDPAAYVAALREARSGSAS